MPKLSLVELLEQGKSQGCFKDYFFEYRDDMECYTLRIIADENGTFCYCGTENEILEALEEDLKEDESVGYSK